MGEEREVDVHTLKWEVAQISQYFWSNIHLFFLILFLKFSIYLVPGNAGYIFLVLNITTKKETNKQTKIESWFNKTKKLGPEHRHI